jgi:hypothetical protein
VHAWALPRLSRQQRDRVEVAMRAAIAELGPCRWDTRVAATPRAAGDRSGRTGKIHQRDHA